MQEFLATEQSRTKFHGNVPFHGDDIIWYALDKSKYEYAITLQSAEKITGFALKFLRQYLYGSRAGTCFARKYIANHPEEKWYDNGDIIVLSNVNISRGSGLFQSTGWYLIPFESIHNFVEAYVRGFCGDGIRKSQERGALRCMDAYKRYFTTDLQSKISVACGFSPNLRKDPIHVLDRVEFAEVYRHLSESMTEVYPGREQAKYDNLFRMVLNYAYEDICGKAWLDAIRNIKKMPGERIYQFIESNVVRDKIAVYLNTFSATAVMMRRNNLVIEGKGAIPSPLAQFRAQTKLTLKHTFFLPVKWYSRPKV